jgi:hypothetical protein
VAIKREVIVVNGWLCNEFSSDWEYLENLPDEYDFWIINPMIECKRIVVGSLMADENDTRGVVKNIHTLDKLDNFYPSSPNGEEWIAGVWFIAHDV